jgi:hypothetical protein
MLTVDTIFLTKDGRQKCHQQYASVADPGSEPEGVVGQTSVLSGAAAMAAVTAAAAAAAEKGVGVAVIAVGSSCARQVLLAAG